LVKRKSKSNSLIDLMETFRVFNLLAATEEREIPQDAVACAVWGTLRVGVQPQNDMRAEALY
jgi:hypothetical protein